MFKHLFDLGFRRSALQALGFYIIYLLLVILGSVAVVSLLSPFSDGTTFEEGYEFGVKVGTVVASFLCAAIAAGILKKKNLLGHIGYLLLALLGGILGYTGGGLLGLIPAAYLSTIPAKAPKKAS